MLYSVSLQLILYLMVCTSDSPAKIPVLMEGASYTRKNTVQGSEMKWFRKLG